MVTAGLLSVFAIGASQAMTWADSSTTGPTSPGVPDLSASNTADLLSGLLKSGPLAQMRESGSYATLLERQALIRIKLVNGQLAAVITPGTACPAR